MVGRTLISVVGVTAESMLRPRLGNNPPFEPAQLRLQLLDLRLQTLDRQSLLLGFVQKQRREQVVAHALRAAFPVRRDQSRKDLRHVLRDQADRVLGPSDM